MRQIQKRQNLDAMYVLYVPAFKFCPFKYSSKIHIDFFAYGEIVFGHAFKVSKYLSLG